MTNNKELFLKWTKNLYNVQIVLLVCGVLSVIPMLGNVFGWISRIFSLIVVYILYQLAPVNERYKKAAIFSGVAIVIGLLTHFMNITMVISLAVVICSLVGTYQEYTAHSDMLDGIDNILARKWHSLFNWEVFGGFFVGILVSPIIVLLTILLVVDANILTAIMLVAVTGFDLILDLVYLKYLKRTREQYEAFPGNTEEGQSLDYI